MQGHKRSRSYKALSNSKPVLLWDKAHTNWYISCASDNLNRKKEKNQNKPSKAFEKQNYSANSLRIEAVPVTWGEPWAPQLTSHQMMRLSRERILHYFGEDNTVPWTLWQLYGDIQITGQGQPPRKLLVTIPTAEHVHRIPGAHQCLWAGPSVFLHVQCWTAGKHSSLNPSAFCLSPARCNLLSLCWAAERNHEGPHYPPDTSATCSTWPWLEANSL